MQAIFASKGIYADWDYLATLSPASHIWRQLLRTFRDAMGVGYKGTSHTQADTSDIVRQVSEKAAEWGLLTLNAPQHSMKAEKLTRDILRVGHEKMEPKTKGIVVDFTKRWKLWVTGGKAMDNEEDELPLEVVSEQQEVIGD